ncbi:uncharacterized membrane protein (UPF0127 family) [Pararhizobium capsulatum DSM 1112]|uniref:Uncharacterized membrane protein (UPF0127 family) n=1 Tax=Pararhizobium capsulatum DSM 1112 TaxID=1121113 RepID=A0ABU0BPR1_9HYPH|nr:DUF192 domain-containing protein [Pararhizobium capsulatum]MDQ0320234.1 uncharacterized membrane protein (UPF0127 family) [Pararhizobium capsulatum DSM 1112]
MRPFAKIAASALAALFLYLAAMAVLAADVTFDVAPLTIVTADGHKHDFTVELAVDSDQRALGLMNRREMADNHGMLFDFGQTRQVMMWMKNTYLPLDMLFLRQDGKIATVRENAVPLSETIIDSREPVAFVVELNAGTVKRLGLAEGDTVVSDRIKGQ